ncbi:MAG: AAA family ATPase, partial [bacterium]|nr:AAA family ATPase [bacterium]
LSDRVLAIPELEGEERTLFARHGFNVIATANTRDRGVTEMSAALKRRFNFETIPPIPSLEQEMALVKRQADALLGQAAVPARLGDDVTELLVTTFHELRRGKADGKAVDAPTTVMSTAEAVAVGVAAGSAPRSRSWTSPGPSSPPTRRPSTATATTSCAAAPMWRPCAASSESGASTTSGTPCSRSIPTSTPPPTPNVAASSATTCAPLSR